MTDTMVHRGPDDRGTFLADGVALGVRRLSIVDVEGGHQPFKNEDGSVVAVQNGELYNHEDVRRELARSGHTFRSRCDTEVLPHLYEEVGAAVPEQLLGMFGLAVWDGEQRRGLLARDRLGIKPLYYAEVGDLILFASELKAILASGLVSVELDPEAIDLYLSLGFVPGPWTPLLQVKKLLPGHRIVVERSGWRVEQYWKYPAPEARHPKRSEEEWTEELLELLERAVGDRLMSDVPLGAMLSGGLDSSLIVALMARQMTRPVQTFSVGFAGVADNELGVARATANALGAEHHELELSLSDEIDLDELVWSLDEPLADVSMIGFSALCQLTAKYVTVALSGQGADELLAGYSRYREVAALGRWAGAPASVRWAADRAARVGPRRLQRATGVVLSKDQVAASIAARSEWAEAARSRSALGALRAVDGSALDSALAPRLAARSRDTLARSLHLDGQLSLVDDLLHYFDRTSMAYSLEVRVPFLDHRVVEFCAGIPTALKLKNGTTKYILRQAARGIVPDSILDRPKVGFLSAGLSEWFRTQIGGKVGDVLLDPGARYAELVDRGEIIRLIEGKQSYRRSKLLLSLLMLELWLSSYLPRATTRAVPARAAALS
jgi:asparagine synthase (glutamine-hydrolysing)